MNSEPLHKNGVPIFIEGSVKIIPDPNVMTRELYDINDLEKILPFKRDYICELRDKGYLQMTRMGKKYVITRNQLDKFIEKVESGEIYINEELL